MVKFFVCKTVVAYPGKVKYAATSEGGQLAYFDSVRELAWGFWRGAPGMLPEEPRILKNEVPGGDILWEPDYSAYNSVTLFEKLSREELHDLVRQLRAGPKLEEAA
jgi:hypothetical protein